MKILMFDCEIINCIPTGENNPNLTYCQGWRDFPGMGISVIGTWRNFKTFNPKGKYEAFVNELDWFPSFNNQIPKPFQKFQKLVNQADLIIGFNSLSFDDPLCQKNGISVITDFDLLVEVRKADGQGDGFYQYGVTKKGFALKDLAAQNLPINKSGSGELAPVLWQQGKHQEVIDYCLRDVRILKELYFLFIENKLRSPLTGEIIPYQLNSYQAHLDWIKRAYS